MTDLRQVSTEDPISHGTAFNRHLALISQATVCIFLSCFYPGTGLIWRSMRYFRKYLSRRVHWLTVQQQILYTHIRAVVNEFTDSATRNRYANAALSWRHPYWDWAAQPSDGGSVLPTSITNPTVTVIMPNGTSTIPNPLYSYRFHEVSQKDFYYNPVRLPALDTFCTAANFPSQWSTWNTTLRAPTTDGVDASSRDETLDPILDQSRISNRDRLYNLFTFYSNYSEFSTESYAFGTDLGNVDSLESIHDVIHGVTGSGGHMTYLDYSAFDPIFWLHHMMVDRSFALWQAVNPNSYVVPTKAFQNTYTIPAGQTLDENTRKSLACMKDLVVRTC